MTQNKYLPEGSFDASNPLREYLQNTFGIEKAISDGVIFQSRATLCDNEHTLHVELPNGLLGIIPFEECVAESENAKPICAISRVGKYVCFKIIGKRQNPYGQTEIILSRKSAQEECRQNYIEKLSAGSIIPAKVTHIEQFGAFCDIGCGLVSLLPIDSMSVSRISHPKERFENGQSIFAVVKTPCDENGRIMLSHRELLGTWEENASNFSVGQTVTGIVRSIESYGIFIELAPNLAGLAEYSGDIEVGDNVSVFIKSIIPQKMKIKLVIIDRADHIRRTNNYEYYMTSGSINRWHYSPEGAIKNVETVF